MNPEGVAPFDEAAAAWFKGLADANRVTIVRHLLTGEHRVTDLVDHLGLAQSTVSAHVAVLRRAGMLSSHVHGRATYYALAHPDEIRSLLELVPRGHDVAHGDAS